MQKWDNVMSGSETPRYVGPTAVMPSHASTCHIALTNSDFVLVFAVAKPSWRSSQGLVAGLELEPVSTVSLSPITARQLLNQLTQAISDFERTTHSTIPEVGEIITTANVPQPPVEAP
jgi:hypothetical protein